MIYLLPVLINLIQGYCLMTLLFPVADRPRTPLMIFWGGLLGMGSTAFVTFSSLLFFNQILPSYVIIANTALTAALLFMARRNNLTIPFGKGNWDRNELIGLHVILAIMIPVVLAARLYPHGGWDAWSCWNLKAVFLFSAGDDWKRMFDPVLWRSNTAYPFLLPLVNVWSWCFGSEPSLGVTMMTSCRIAFLMAALLYFGLKELTGNPLSLLAPLWILAISFVVTLASSQYSDLLTGTWFLSALAALQLFRKRQVPGYLLVFIASLGLMSFTKSEGLVLALITGAVAKITILTSPALRTRARGAWKQLVLAAALAFLPTIVFQCCWASDSHTFVNGLTSVRQPASLERLKAVFVFLGIELINLKWNFFWILSALGVLLARGRAWKKGLWVIPVILAFYLAALIAVYCVNTFFPIIWWLSTTLNRLLLALMPAIAFWVFLAHLNEA